MSAKSMFLLFSSLSLFYGFVANAHGVEDVRSALVSDAFHTVRGEAFPVVGNFLSATAKTLRRVLENNGLFSEAAPHEIHSGQMHQGGEVRVVNTVSQSTGENNCCNDCGPLDLRCRNFCNECPTIQNIVDVDIYNNNNNLRQAEMDHKVIELSSSLSPIVQRGNIPSGEYNVAVMPEGRRRIAQGTLVDRFLHPQGGRYYRESRRQTHHSRHQHHRRSNICCADCTSGDLDCLSTCQVNECHNARKCTNAGEGVYAAFCQQKCSSMIGHHFVPRFLPDAACRGSCAAIVQQLCSKDMCKSYGCIANDCMSRAAGMCE